MAKQGFKRNAKAIRQILMTNEAAKPYAEQIAADAGGEVVEYTTDRKVFGVRVPADEQAKNGSATRAANRVAGG